MELIENRTSRVALSPGEVDALLARVPELRLVPARGAPGHYDVTPSQFVGRVDVGDVQIDIRPKVPIRSLMFMLAYAMDPRHWRDLYAAFADEPGPLDAVAAAFARELSRTLARGLLRGYTPRQEALPVLRGRVVVTEQLRRWYGQMPPIECAYDEFTEDVLENRLLKAALTTVRNMRVRRNSVRMELARSEIHLENVASVAFDPRALPEIGYTRLNERFRRAIEIAKLILRSTTIETGRRGVTSSAFLVDMAGVFEHFVLTALAETRAIAPWVVPLRKEHRYMDVAERLRLIPDLTFRNQGRVVCVGDVKYKRTPPVGVLHPDVYQVLAYAVAFDLRHAFLVYPSGEEDIEPGVHVIRNAGKCLNVMRLNLDVEPSRILEGVDQLARAVRAGVGIAA